MEGGAGGRGHLRIGELSRRSGVSADVLRAWERRYGLLSPSRTRGGFRLYGDDDERRVRVMLEHLARGVAAAEAAELARSQDPRAAEGVPVAAAPVLGATGDELRRALDGFDEPAAQAALDRLLAGFAVETVLRDVVLPYLHELGERWVAGESSVAQEHFASSLLRGRLLGLARGWGSGGGPLGLLACLPGEQHDLALICFGLALRGQGWRITFLGPDTPLETIAELASRLKPAIVVVNASLSGRAAAARDGLLEVARSAPLALAGGGVDGAIAAAVGARHLSQDPVSAAATVATEWSRRPGG
jgi:DNA-binding transcriptional MerR regulator